MTEASELIQKTLDLYHKFPDSDEVPGITMGHLRALMRERDTLLDTHADKADAWDVMAKKNETIATLRQQLAEARNAALEEAAARIGPKGEEPCTDPSNHGDTIELAAWHEANNCAASILALKTNKGGSEDG